LQNIVSFIWLFCKRDLYFLGSLLIEATPYGTRRKVHGTQRKVHDEFTHVPCQDCEAAIDKKQFSNATSIMAAALQAFGKAGLDEDERELQTRGIRHSIAQVHSLFLSPPFSLPFSLTLPFSLSYLSLFLALSHS